MEGDRRSPEALRGGEAPLVTPNAGAQGTKEYLGVVYVEGQPLRELTTTPPVGREGCPLLEPLPEPSSR